MLEIIRGLQRIISLVVVNTKIIIYYTIHNQYHFRSSSNLFFNLLLTITDAVGAKKILNIAFEIFNNHMCFFFVLFAYVAYQRHKSTGNKIKPVYLIYFSKI